MNLPVIILGGGGHAKVLIDALHLQKRFILGVADPQLQPTEQLLSGVSVIGNDEIVLQYSPDSIELVNGLGSIGIPKLRQQIFERFKELAYTFASVIHPSAVIATNAKLAEGVQVMAGGIIQAESLIGKNTIINTKASIDHNCAIGPHVHIAPGVTLSGNVEVGQGTHIGTGATVIQGIKIGKNCVVGAGAVVIRDVQDQVLVVGVPAKEIGSIIDSNIRKY